MIRYIFQITKLGGDGGVGTKGWGRERLLLVESTTWIAMQRPLRSLPALPQVLSLPPNGSHSPARVCDTLLKTLLPLLQQRKFSISKMSPLSSEPWFPYYVPTFPLLSLLRKMVLLNLFLFKILSVSLPLGGVIPLIHERPPFPRWVDWIPGQNNKQTGSSLRNPSKLW